MNIAICIKHVPVSNDVSVDPVTHALIRENTEGMVNPADLNSIEQGVCLKDRHGADVVVFTMGPPDAEKSLRTALSMGCDDAVLVSDRCFAGADTVATAKVLAAALRHRGDFDLILTGAQTADGATGQVGPMVAALLGIPHISDARSLDCGNYAEGRIEASKQFGGNTIRLAVACPVLVSMSFGCNKPRFPTLRSKLTANKKELTVYTNDDLDLPRSEVGLDGSPTVVIDSFAPERNSKAEYISGSAKEIARRILDLVNGEEANS